MIAVNFRRAVHVALILVSFPARVCCQTQNGEISGSVSDSSGAAIPHAEIQITNTQTGFVVHSFSSSDGLFHAPQLPVGDYSVVAHSVGFADAVDSRIQVRAGSTTRVELKLAASGARQEVSVSSNANLINLEDSLLSDRVDTAKMENLPLNGRNVFDLLQQAPGSVNVKGVVYESGASTSINGLRANFNGFFLNGATIKKLSGGYTHPPILDTVDEYQVQTLNNSAEFGNSAGSITNVVTKSGGNAYHGSSWWALRNDALDATPFFIKQIGQVKPRLRFNQFGIALGGPIKKNRVFFFLAYEGELLKTATVAAPVLSESPEFRQAVETAFPDSVAALLYSQFAPNNPGLPALTLNQYVQGPDHVFGGSAFSGGGFSRFSDYLCPDRIGIPLAGKFASLFGVTAQDQADLSGTCSAIPAQRVGVFNRDQPFLVSAATSYPTQVSDNLANGNQANLRLDFNKNDRLRTNLTFNWYQTTNQFAGSVPGFSADVITTAVRGFTVPSRYTAPEVLLNATSLHGTGGVNQFRLGYSGDYAKFTASFPGVPSVLLLDGTLGFGASTGFPRDFKEHIYTLGDTFTVISGRHTWKAGVDLRRNSENSDFNVGRPTYLFFDPLFFAVDAPFFEAAGVNPQFSTNAASQLSTNIRHWRNLELGSFIHDDWRVTNRLTINAGLRYDLFTRHVEAGNLATTFLLGPGNGLIDDLSTGAGQLKAANNPAGTPGCNTPPQIKSAQLAGACGPGGFAQVGQLGAGDHNNFGPRLGFAWDVFGAGKVALRGGFGVSYEGTLYDQMSFSRYNPPFYSFNQVNNFLVGDVGSVVYGPQVAGQLPTFLGPSPAQQNAGTGQQANGNISAWDPSNPNLSGTNGLVFSTGLRDPFVFNWFLGMQWQLAKSVTLETNYVATQGHDLFRAEDINRVPGGQLPQGVCVTDNFGRKVCSQINFSLGSNLRPLNPSGKVNPNYSVLRAWENVVGSIYNGLQVSLRKSLSKKFQASGNYAWSHSIDGGSTWFSTFTTANGSAAGDGYTTDPTNPSVDRGNSIFDIRHRFTASVIWELPEIKGLGTITRTLVNGWQVNGIISLQSGAHWSPFDPRPKRLVAMSPGACNSATFDASTCRNAGGDYNLDGQANDRPNAIAENVNATTQQWANGFGLPAGFFSAPCLGCTGTLGRNTFVGPGFWNVDFSLFRSIRIKENIKTQFRVEAFNLMNHTNFQLPGNAGHNRINDPLFGKAGGTFNPRQLQLGVRATF